METGIERINLRRASLSAGRSGLWTYSYCSELKEDDSLKHNDEVNRQISKPGMESPSRCELPSLQISNDDQCGTDGGNNVLVIILAISFVGDCRLLFFPFHV